MLYENTPVFGVVFRETKTDFNFNMTMNDFDDYSANDGDATHDMMVDYDYHQNTGELSEYFDNEYTSGEYCNEPD